MKEKHLLPADALCLLLLVLLAPLFFRQIALQRLVLPGVDAFTYFYPYRSYAAQAVRRGDVPLWNPYLFMGVPFLANAQAAPFYPLNVALCWLSGPALLAWSAVVHVVIAAVTAYFYGRHVLRLSPLPALLAGGAFAFGGFLGGQVEHINQLNVSAWLPLLLLLWEVRRRWRWPSLVGMGVVVGLGLLAGHAQSSYISVTGLVVYAALGALRDGWRAAQARASWRARLAAGLSPLLRSAGELAFVGLLGAGLAAVQLLPTLELAPLSIRSGGLTYREAVAFSLKPLPGLLRYTFLPPWGASRGDLASRFGGDFFSEYLAYTGTLSLLLAVCAVAGSLWRAVARRKGTRYEGPAQGGVFRLSSSQHGLKRSRSGSFSRFLTKVHRLKPPFRQNENCWFRLAVLAGTGLLLALGLYNPLYYILYRIVPGFGLFRVPARWLLWYAFGAAMLAGVGLQRAGAWWSQRMRAAIALPRGAARWWSRPSLVPAAVVLLTLVELFATSQVLAFNHATAPEAFSSLRPAPAHILVVQDQEVMPGRVLSMSDILFDPGDLAAIQSMFRDQLPPSAIYDYVVCVKRKEILAPNLPLSWQVYAVDGYDGGVLPLARYVQLQRLLLEEDEILPDGRLREGLERIPPSRLLSILGVRWVLTDKVHDVWIDDVFYDLAFEAILDAQEGEGSRSVEADVTTQQVEPYIATAVGVVSYLQGASDIVDGTPVAEVRLATVEGNEHILLLRAGQDTAEGVYGEGIAHPQARVGQRWPDQPEGAAYVARLHLEAPSEIAQVKVTALPTGGRLHVRGVTLIDERDGTNVPLIMSTSGRFRQTHSGDVKVYEVLDALPRAYVVHHTRRIADDAQAIEAMADASFDPAQTAILASGTEIAAPASPSSVTVTHYSPQAIRLDVTLSDPGYLVVSDTWYPGWEARVDGVSTPIERANVHFRALYLSPGTHAVQFTYQPRLYSTGLGISLFSLAGVVWGAHLMVLRRLRTKTSPRSS